jgi:hypothetical protein
LAGSGYAFAAAVLPPMQHAGNVEYLSGGIGQDESRAIEHVAKAWPLTLEFAMKDRQRSDFVADVAVVVRDAKGRVALKTESDGPFLLARLAPGKYEVDATLDGKTLHEQVSVRQGEPTRTTFLWPAGTDKLRS